VGWAGRDGTVARRRAAEARSLKSKVQSPE
jgi:hypothetical protein